MTFLGDQRDMWQDRALKAEAEKEEYVSAYRLTNAKLIKAEEALRTTQELYDKSQYDHGLSEIRLAKAEEALASTVERAAWSEGRCEYIGACLTKAEEALRETVAALIALRDAVQKSKALESRQYVGLGIQVNQAIARAAFPDSEVMP